eukprot:10424947-Alexandrium_andersonii.AAC.1
MSRKIKPSSVVDVTAEAEVVMLDAQEIQELFEDYKATRGDYPHRDMEPTPDQLSAVKQLISGGAPPYVDFASFGPRGHRVLKKLMFTAFSYSVHTPEFHRQELPGPPSVDAWWKARM